ANTLRNYVAQGLIAARRVGPKLLKFDGAESPWKSWRFLTLETRMQVCRKGIVKLLTLFGRCEDWSLWRLRRGRRVESWRGNAHRR
ncbi:MAG: hypothetical protein WBE50_03050, partial [Methyloceanibacter sp.]